MRRTMQALLLALLPGLGLAACAQEAAQEGAGGEMESAASEMETAAGAQEMSMAMDPAEVRSAIEGLTAEWETAFNAGDAATLAGLYAADATLLPEGGEMVRGGGAIQQFWSAMMAEMPEGATLDLETVEVQTAGDLAYEIGRSTFTLGPETVEEGKYLVVWRHEPDGSWKLVADIWNANESPDM